MILEHRKFKNAILIIMITLVIYVLFHEYLLHHVAYTSDFWSGSSYKRVEFVIDNGFDFSKPLSDPMISHHASPFSALQYAVYYNSDERVSLAIIDAIGEKVLDEKLIDLLYRSIVLNKANVCIRLLNILPNEFEINTICNGETVLDRAIKLTKIYNNRELIGALVTKGALTAEHIKKNGDAAPE